MDSIYKFDIDKVEVLRQRPKEVINADPKFIKRVKVSPSALMKMMMHAQSGVDKGRRGPGGLPIEVMGKLIGVPDVSDDRCIIIIDAKPLNADGGETRVEMPIEASIYDADSNEHREVVGRNECEVGWYHSHPFESEVEQVQTFFSQTDITNHRINAQNSTYVGIVLDPQKSAEVGRPVIEAYCTYYGDIDNFRETPDGTPIRQDNDRVRKEDMKIAEKRWANGWMKYYRVEMTYFTSSLTKRAISSIQNNFMYETTLSKAEAYEQDQIDEKMDLALKSMTVKTRTEVRPASATSLIAKSTGSLGQAQALQSYGQLVRKSLVDIENA